MGIGCGHRLVASGRNGSLPQMGPHRAVSTAGTALVMKKWPELAPDANAGVFPARFSRATGAADGPGLLPNVSWPRPAPWREAASSRARWALAAAPASPGGLRRRDRPAHRSISDARSDRE